MVKSKKFLFIIIGGISGLILHLVRHFGLNIPIFSFSSHIIEGIIYTIVGMIIGLIIGRLIK